MDRFVTAHVEYVTEPEDSPDPIGFLMEVLAEPGTLLLFAIGALIIVVALLAWAWWRPLEDARLRLIRRTDDYHAYLPWIVRLSVGLVLIGSGLSRVQLLPTVPADGLPVLVLTATGFLILLGLAVRLAALVALMAYAVTFIGHPELVMMLDVAGALGAVALLGPGLPSVDDLLRAAFPRGPGGQVATENLVRGGYDDVVPLLIRLGLGGAFVASGIIDKLVIYEQALAAVDKYGLTAVVPVSPGMWVVGAMAIETALGVAILLGAMTRLCAVIGFTVLTLALFALPDDPVIAHVSLFGLCSALVILGGGRWSLDRLVLEPIGERLRRT